MSNTKRVNTNPPTGLSISRSGGNFTCSWKIGDADYGGGQWFQYQVNWGPASGWIPIGGSETSRTLGLGSVAQVAFWVKGKRKNYNKKVKKTTTYYKPNVSAEAVTEWRATIPVTPALSYSRDASNKGTFSWSVPTSDTDTALFSYVQYETCISRSNENPPGSGWSGSSQGASGSATYTETLSGNNLVRWVRARAHGPAGVSGWAYSHHAYGNPSTPRLESASGSGSQITAAWNGAFSLLYPTDEITVQYAIAVPTDSIMSAPATGWTDSLTVAANGGRDKVVVHISDDVGLDECIWIRLKAKHDDSNTFSNALLGYVGVLKTPGIEATPNVTTGDVAISIDENTTCEAAGTVIFYRSEKTPDNDQVVAIFDNGTTSGTVHIDEIMNSYAGHVDTTCFGAYAFIGTYEENSVTHERTLKTVRMRSGTATDEDLLARPPAWVGLSEGTQDDSVRISWPWTWKAATSAELAWADHDDAWESTDEPSTYEINERNISNWIIAKLSTGKRWYFRVRFKFKDDDEEITGPWSEMYDYDLSTIPTKPVLILSKSVIDKDGIVTARWSYASDDETEQSYADICLATITNNVVSYGTIIAHTSENKTVEITNNWTTGQTYYLCLRLTSTAGRQSEWSDPIALFIAPPISLSVTQNSLETVDGLKYLTSLPLTVTATGAGTAGKTIATIVRAEDYHLYRPDDSEFDGFAGENIASASRLGEGQLTITTDDLVGALDDGAKYILTVTAIDEYEQTASVDYPFSVDWTHQAGKPSATVRVDKWQRIAIITPIAPDNYVSGDVCDIYRLSADKPELIVKGASFGTAYVDPFPAFGDFCGHRIVTKTANGDYITANNELAWFLCDSDVGDILEDDSMVIDVNGDQIELPYNIELQNNWTKDFKRTSYLGGSVKGDWNPAVTRDTSANTVIIRGDDLDTQLSMRELADYAGIAHIRTPDGSSVAADIQVRETMNYNTMKVSYSLAIKVIDPDRLDGMTFSEWQALHPAE